MTVRSQADIRRQVYLGLAQLLEGELQNGSEWIFEESLLSPKEQIKAAAIIERIARDFRRRAGAGLLSL